MPMSETPDSFADLGGDVIPISGLFGRYRFPSLSSHVVYAIALFTRATSALFPQAPRQGVHRHAFLVWIGERGSD